MKINLTSFVVSLLFVFLGLFAIQVQAAEMSRSEIVAAEKIMDSTRNIRVGTGVIVGGLGAYAGYTAAAQLALPLPATILTVVFNGVYGFAAGYGLPTLAMEVQTAAMNRDIKNDCQELQGQDSRIDQACREWFGELPPPKAKKVDPDKKVTPKVL